MTIELERIDYAQQGALIDALRTRVFVEEQRIDRGHVWDDRDEACHHVLAKQSGIPVGTARIDLGRAGKVGRVAVVESARRQGIGRLLMDALIEIARENGLAEIWFHAQESAIPFYTSTGYVADGETFLEAGIVHVTMRKPI